MILLLNLSKRKTSNKIIKFNFVWMKNYSNNKRGLFIVFEGVDRAGKTTQLEMLKNYFENTRNEKCEEMRFPSKMLFYLR